MCTRTRRLGALLLVATATILIFAAGASARKPPKPPPDPITNPALAYGIDGELWIATADGQKTAKVIDIGRGNVRYAQWQPDGGRIGYVKVIRRTKPPKLPVFDALDLYSVEVDHTDLTLHVELFGHREFQWFLGGDAVSYDRLKVLDLATGTVIQTLDLRANHAADEVTDWASLGPDAEPGIPGYQGWVCYTVYSITSQTTEGDVCVAELATDQDGDLYVVSGTVHRLERSGKQAFPEFSPDYDELVFYDEAVGTVGGTDLMIVSVSPGSAAVFGTPARILDSTEDVLLGRPSWSPDGAWIAVNRDHDLYRLRPDGTGLTRLTTDGGVFEFHWSPAWTNDLD